MFKCWDLASSSDHSVLWSLLSSFQSSKWQLWSFSHSASWVYEEHYFLPSYASLKLSLYTYQHRAMPGYFVDFFFFFFLGIPLYLLVVTWGMQALWGQACLYGLVVPYQLAHGHKKCRFKLLRCFNLGSSPGSLSTVPFFASYSALPGSMCSSLAVWA